MQSGYAQISLTNPNEKMLYAIPERQSPSNSCLKPQSHIVINHSFSRICQFLHDNAAVRAALDEQLTRNVVRCGLGIRS
jgi:hypothetical protein